jgi:hypothetical protein
VTQQAKRTGAGLNDNADGPRMTTTPKSRHERPKEDPNTPRTTQGRPEELRDHANTPSTTRTAQGRREHPKDDPSSPPNSPWTTRRPQRRREPPRDDANTPSTTRKAHGPPKPPNDGAEGRTRRWIAHHARVGEYLGPTRTGRGFGAEPGSALVFYV